MRRRGPTLVLSATDLSNFLGCRHRTALDIAASLGKRKRPHFEDPLRDLLFKRGLEHEARYVDSLKARTPGVVELGHLRNSGEHLTATLDAMRAGTDVIVQGALTDGTWFGQPDVMHRVARPSALGPWSFEITDTKLARETKAGTILQLSLYSELLAAAQGARPEYFSVVTPNADGAVQRYRVNDYAAYFRLMRERMLETVALDDEQIAADNYPEPVTLCEVCPWSRECSARRRADDHLSLVAGITRVQRRELEARTATTLASLAMLPLPLAFTPKRGSPETYVTVREQARLQLASRNVTPPIHEVLPIEPDRGLCRLPEPSPGDLFLDLEGDPFARESEGATGDGTREYLFGVAAADGTYRSAWAFTDPEERRGFEWVIDLIIEAARQHPEMHVYHYAPYEPGAFKRLMGRYATRERELDEMLRAGRFVDLYAVVRQGIRAGIESYSIKSLEPLYGFPREVVLNDANRALKAMEQALEMGIPEALPADVRDVVEGYNRDDCISTLRLRDWLEGVRAAQVAAGTDVPRRTLADGEPSPEVDARAQRVEELRARLLADVPDELAQRTTEQHARWLLAYMLDYHGREEKSTWWEYFRLCDLTEEELFEERDALAGLAHVATVRPVLNTRGKPTGSVIDRYGYPAQEMEIDRGAKLRLQKGERFGEVDAVDRIGLTIDVKKGPTCAAIHPPAVFAFSHFSSDAMEHALLRIGERVAAGGAGHGAARALLAREVPRLVTGTFTPVAGESAVTFAVRIAGALDETILPIQGPPGSGKTYCGARMICELVRQGKRVGVTATSHKVIRHVLDKVAEHATHMGVSVRLAHKVGDEETAGDDACVQLIRDNGEALDALRSGAANVVGGTAWLWARPEFAGAVDVLFVDEAGQMALANVLAVSQAAASLVILGDPQQLEQPRKGSHPDGVGVSALEHVLGGARTMPVGRGIFLPETWRLTPSICAFTSELFYEGRLESHAGLDRQRIGGVAGLPERGLAIVGVAHDGNRNYSPEEVDVVERLVARLTTDVATWVNAEGHEQRLVASDVLVVAPYNAQVSRLLERLEGRGVRVGTVDKFQGQEAPVVIYSMATSRPEDAPRGMEFLYNLNRLNVATSRARCLAILVASPLLLEPECRSPRQMKLANGLCRFRELAFVVP